MRKNAQQTMDAWHAGRSNQRAQSIWTDGISIFSYGTCLVTPVDVAVFDDVAPFIFNATRYSVTTSIHQSGIRPDIPSRDMIVLQDVPQGVSADGLRELADLTRTTGT